MEKDRNKTVIAAYAAYILAAEIISILIIGFDGRVLFGLLAAFVASAVNYNLLILIVGKLLGKANILAVQFFLFRYLFYLIAAYLCMKTGRSAIIMYGIGIIGLSLAIFITYGIGGMKDQ